MHWKGLREVGDQARTEHKRPEKQRVAEGPKKDDFMRSPQALRENSSVVRARPTMGATCKQRNPKEGHREGDPGALYAMGDRDHVLECQAPYCFSAAWAVLT